MKRGRTCLLADGLAALLWVASRRAPFRHDEFAIGCGFTRRTAYRWLTALESVGAIEPSGYETRRAIKRTTVYRVGRFESAIEQLAARAA